MTRSVRDALMASLEADLPGSVFKSYSVKGPDGKIITYPNRYAVVFVARSRKDRPRYTSGQLRDSFTVTVHSVGGSEDQALWVEERVNKLTGKQLVITGQKLWPVEYVTGHAPQLDDDGPKPLWWVVSQFDIISDPEEV